MGNDQPQPIHYSMEGVRGTSSVSRGTERRDIHRGRLNARQEREAVQYTRRQGYTRRQIAIIQQVVGMQESGTYTGLTADRVAQWQLRHQERYGLASIDGKVGAETLAAMVQHLVASGNYVHAVELHGQTGKVTVGDRSTFIIAGQPENKVSVPEWLSYTAPVARKPPSRVAVHEALADNWAHTPLYVDDGRIYEYSANGVRTDELTFPNNRGYYQVGDVILKGKHPARQVIRMFPELAPPGEVASITNPEYTIGHKIIGIKPSDADDGDGHIITRGVIFFSGNEQIALEETTNWTRGSLESAFSNHKRGKSLIGLMTFVEPGIEVMTSIATGGRRAIVQRGLRNAAAGALRKVARRSIKRLLVKFGKVVLGAAGEAVKTFVVELGKNLAQQRTDATLRQRATARRQPLDREDVLAAIEQAAASAAAKLISETLGSQLDSELGQASKDLFAVDPVLGATLRKRLQQFLTQQVVKVFTIDAAAILMQSVAQAHAQGLRTGEQKWRQSVDASTLKVMEEYLKQELKTAFTAFGKSLLT